MKRRGASKNNTDANRQKVMSIPPEVLEWAWDRLLLEYEVITHGLEEEDELFFCWQNPTIADRGYREGADSLAQIEIFKSHSDEAAMFIAAMGRSAFTPSHLLLACQGIYLKDDETASHLCGNFRCLRPDHIIVETLKVNVARKFCVGTIQCKCGAHMLCKHTPMCLIKRNVK